MHCVNDILIYKNCWIQQHALCNMLSSRADNWQMNACLNPTSVGALESESCVLQAI